MTKLLSVFDIFSGIGGRGSMEKDYDDYETTRLALRQDMQDYKLYQEIELMGCSEEFKPLLNSFQTHLQYIIRRGIEKLDND
jgi:hypothetical protein